MADAAEEAQFELDVGDAQETEVELEQPEQEEQPEEQVAQQPAQEEQEIANYVAMGMPLDKATWAVMGPKRSEDARRTAGKTQQQKTKAKVKANLEQSSVPKSSNIPDGKKLSFREEIELRAREAGLS
jgi:hypothetical protein